MGYLSIKNTNMDKHFQSTDKENPKVINMVINKKQQKQRESQKYS